MNRKRYSALLCFFGLQNPTIIRAFVSPQQRALTFRARTHSPHVEEADSAPHRPTAELPQRPEIKSPPARPKIVVLGATGSLGRRVIRQLLEMDHLDATIVAFVRDYDKACRVFFDDILVASNQKKGPKLQIVMGNLVSRRDIPLAAQRKLQEEEDDWRERAKSASLFFRNSIQNYNNGEYLDENEEALEEAIRDCTAVISCVGSVRMTNLWTDVIARPFWRLVKWDVRNWCYDARHPYYVHYRSTSKVLRLAELEQFRRESSAENDQEKSQIPRIRFIRVSDLSVTSPPWQLIPILANALYSMVYRYQALSEQMLEQSTLVDTITLRSGDIVDDDRDAETTHLQVTSTGRLPSPARVSRDDVASVVVEGALFRQPKRESLPFHYCLACRWVSDQLSQGHKKDGFPTARMCMKEVLRKLRKQRRSKPVASRKVKPYGICVAVPVYLVLTLTLFSIIQSVLAIASNIPTPVKNAGGRLAVSIASWNGWSKLGRAVSLGSRTQSYISR